MPDYGLDRPALTQLAVGVGAALIVAGIVLWPVRPGWLGPLVVVAGVGAVAVAASLLAYARGGKLRVRDAMLAMVAWRGDERVLDVGTGRGLLAVGAARRTRGTVTGVDLWEDEADGLNTRARAEAVVAAEGVVVALEQGDARALAYADGAFDVVLSLNCLGAIRDGAERDAALAGMARVLAPGGTLVLAGAGARGQALSLAGLGLRVDRAVDLSARAWMPMAVVRARKRA